MFTFAIIQSFGNFFQTLRFFNTVEVRFQKAKDIMKETVDPNITI